MSAAILTLVLLLVPLVSVKSQNNANTSTKTNTYAWRTYAMVGPVRTVRTETATLVEQDGRYIEGPRILSMTIAFNEDINRTEVSFHDPKGALVRRITTKYEGRRSTESANYNGQGRMWLRMVNLYDDKEQFIGEAAYDGEGKPLWRTVLKRNSFGQVAESSKFDPKGILLEHFITTYNDERERVFIERRYYRYDGSRRERELVDLKAKRSETTKYEPDGTVSGTSIRVNKTITDSDKDGAVKKTTNIGDIGRLLDVSTNQSDGGTTKVSEIPDELDSRGNWVKQTTWVSDAKGRRPIKVTYRLITYY